MTDLYSQVKYGFGSQLLKMVRKMFLAGLSIGIGIGIGLGYIFWGR